MTAPARWREGRRRSLEKKTDSLASTQVLARAARRAPRAAQDTALVPPRRRAGERRCAAPRGTSLGLPRAGHRRRRRRRRGAGRGGAAAPGAVQARARAGGGRRAASARRRRGRGRGRRRRRRGVGEGRGLHPDALGLAAVRGAGARGRARGLHHRGAPVGGPTRRVEAGAGAQPGEERPAAPAAVDLARRRRDPDGGGAQGRQGQCPTCLQ